MTADAADCFLNLPYVVEKDILKVSFVQKQHLILHILHTLLLLVGRVGFRRGRELPQGNRFAGNTGEEWHGNRGARGIRARFLDRDNHRKSRVFGGHHSYKGYRIIVLDISLFLHIENVGRARFAR